MKFLIKPSSLCYDGMIPTKVCTGCNHAKDIGEFYYQNDWYSSKCIECYKEYVKEYRQSAKYKEYKKEYRQSAKYKKYQKEYEKSDKYKKYKREYQKKRRQTHKYKEYVKEYCKSDKRKEYLKEYNKEYLKIPHNRIANNLRARVREAIKNGYKSAPTIKLLGCTTDFLMHWIELQFKEGMSWDNYGNPNGDHSDCWHIDHIKPCASFDLTDPKQQRECFHYKNLQPLWASENLSKGAKL